MTFPVLALLASLRPPEEVVPLLAALAEHCTPLVPDDGVPPPAAALSTHPSLGRLPGVPLAVWVSSVGDLHTGTAPGAEVILTRDEPVLAAERARALWVPVHRFLPGPRPVSPFVRARIRAARGLPQHVVVLPDDDDLRWPGRVEPLAQGEVDTALACASSVVATGADRVLRALAWGAATVTDAATALELGAQDGVHLHIGPTADLRRELAERLAVDSARAASFGWAGRRLVEQRHDVDHAAAVLARRLGLLGGNPAVALPRAQLAELGTPPGARVRTRLTDAVSVLTASGSRT